MSRRDKSRKGVFGKVLKGIRSNVELTPAQQAAEEKRAKQLEKDRKAIAESARRARLDRANRELEQRNVAEMKRRYEEEKRRQEGR